MLATIRMRRGLQSEFEDAKDNLQSGEMAVTTDTGHIYMTLENGNVKRLLTEGDGGDVPIATTEIAGKVKPDGTTIEIKDDGTIKLPFRLGVDADGNYGYYKVGADTLTPFKSSSGGTIETLFEVNTRNVWNQTTNDTTDETLIMEKSGTLNISFSFICAYSSSTALSTANYIIEINGEQKVNETVDGSASLSGQDSDIFKYSFNVSTGDSVRIYAKTTYDNYFGSACRYIRADLIY